MGYSMSCAALALREAAEAAYGAEAEGFAPHRVDPTTDGEAPDPDDAAEDLADQIATLAAHIHAATRRLLVLIARFDRLGGWEAGGHRSCAHWLSYRTGLGVGTAREHVRVARALEGLPRIGRAMGRGRLSFSRVRALTRVAEASNEAELLELAEGCTTAQLERMVRAWKKGSRQDEAARERERRRSRRLSVFPDEEGMYVVKGRLEPEVGAVLMRAVEAAGDALYRQARPAGGGPEEETRDTRHEAARRRADAVGLLAERALAAGFGGGGAEPEVSATESEELERPPADADATNAETEASAGQPTAQEPNPEPGSGCECRKSAVPISGTRAERYQVMLHVEPETLSAGTARRRRGAGEPGRSELEDGTRVSAETSRRLACDVAVVSVAHDPDGSLLDVGRRRRTVPPALRRALEVRDRGCRFPGCGLRFTDAHHVKHWADGGKTSLGNTLLLCRHHHRLVHEGDWRVEWWGKGRPAFRDPRGSVHMHMEERREPPAVSDDPVAALVRDNRARGADPDAMTAGARWKRERDIPDEVYFGATGAW